VPLSGHPCRFIITVSTVPRRFGCPPNEVVPERIIWGMRVRGLAMSSLTSLCDSSGWTGRNMVGCEFQYSSLEGEKLSLHTCSRGSVRVASTSLPCVCLRPSNCKYAYQVPGNSLPLSNNNHVPARIRFIDIDEGYCRCMVNEFGDSVALNVGEKYTEDVQDGIASHQQPCRAAAFLKCRCRKGTRWKGESPGPRSKTL